MCLYLALEHTLADILVSDYYFFVSPRQLHGQQKNHIFTGTVVGLITSVLEADATLPKVVWLSFTARELCKCLQYLPKRMR